MEYPSITLTVTFKDLINSSLVHSLPISQISWKSTHNFLTYPLQRQTKTNNWWLKHYPRQPVAELNNGWIEDYITNQLIKASITGTNKSTKDSSQGNPTSSGKQTWGSDAGKTQCHYHYLCGGALQQGKYSMAYEHSSSDIVFCLKTDTDTVILTFWPQHKQVSKFIVEHLYVKFGDPNCISFWDIVQKTDKVVKTVPIKMGNNDDTKVL